MGTSAHCKLTTKNTSVLGKARMLKSSFSRDSIIIFVISVVAEAGTNYGTHMALQLILNYF